MHNLMRSPVRITLRCWHSSPQPVRRPPQPRPASHLEVERKFVPSWDFHHRIETLMARNIRDHRNPASTIWSAVKTERIRDTYYDRNNALASKGIWIRYRDTTSAVAKDNGTTPGPLIQGHWDAKVRLGGDFIESQFAEHQGEQSVRDLLLNDVPGTMLEDLEIIADLETTRTTWNIRLRDRYSLEGRAECSDAGYLTVALDRVASLIERRTDDQCSPIFDHVVGEIELTKRMDSISEDEDGVGARKMDLDRMKIQIETFMKDNPGLFSQSKPTGKLSAYFDWKRASDI